MYVLVCTGHCIKCLFMKYNIIIVYGILFPLTGGLVYSRCYADAEVLVVSSGEETEERIDIEKVYFLFLIYTQIFHITNISSKTLHLISLTVLRLLILPVSSVMCTGNIHFICPFISK